MKTLLAAVMAAFLFLTPVQAQDCITTNGLVELVASDEFNSPGIDIISTYSFPLEDGTTVEYFKYVDGNPTGNHKDYIAVHFDANGCWVDQDFFFLYTESEYHSNIGITGA